MHRRATCNAASRRPAPCLEPALLGGVEGFALTTGLQCESSSYRRTALCACHMCVRCTRKSTADVYCDGLCGFVARAKPTCRRVSSARASSRAQSGAPSQGSASSAQASEASLTWNMPPHRVPGRQGFLLCHILLGAAGRKHKRAFQGIDFDNPAKNYATSEAN